MQSLSVHKLAHLLIVLALAAGLAGAAPSKAQTYDAIRAVPTIAAAPQDGDWASLAAVDHQMTP
jgi:hypothetical protein